jgi:hypothetical protein
MYTDKNTKLEDGTRALLAPTLTTDLVDLKTLRRMGVNQNTFVDLLVKTAFASAAGCKVTFDLISTPSSQSGALAELTGVTATGTGDIIGKTAHGLAPLTPVIFTAVGASTLSLATIYYVTYNATFNANQFCVSTTLANAIAGTPAGIDDGTGLSLVAYPTGLTYVATATDTGDTFSQPTGIVLPDGTAVTYHRALTSTIAGTGVAAGDTLFVTNATSTTFQLATSLSAARQGTAAATVTPNGTALLEILPVVLGSSGPIPVELLFAGANFGLRLNAGLKLGNGYGGENLPVFRYATVRITPSLVCTAGALEVNIGAGDAEQRQYHPHRLSF